MIKYGLISETDARTIEKTIDLINTEFPRGALNVCEIGLYNGETSNGIKEFIWSRGRVVNYTGIDSEKDKPIIKPFEDFNLIIGESGLVYNTISDNSQHFIFQDANHSYPNAVQDFFCYMRKVKVGGYMAWHDTGKHIKEFKDYQSGDSKNPDSYISVRKALNDIGLLANRFHGWELIFDEADPLNEAGGVVVLKKINNGFL